MRNRILFFLVISVGAILYFLPKDEGFSVSKTDPSSVTRIEISKKGSESVLLEKMGGRWKIVSPVRKDVNPEKVKEIFSVLNARSDQKLDAGDLSRFGLDKPDLSLKFDGESFEFGMIYPLTGQQYLHAGNSVYLVSAKYALIPSLSELEHAGTS